MAALPVIAASRRRIRACRPFSTWCIFQPSKARAAITKPIRPRRGGGKSGMIFRQRFGQIVLQPIIARAVPESGPEARRTVAADDPALRILAFDVVDEQVLQGDYVALH